jgi:hypothetical protein
MLTNRNRLRNIEATEKAKREMIEARNLARSTPENRDRERGRRNNESEESYAAARCTFSLHVHSKNTFVV